MKKTDLVSIIIPFYNAKEYIDRCISSIIKQTYNNIEVIFVSDGSTDNTCSKITNYRDKRFFVYEIEKSGVSVARNYGLEKAKGKYIAFMDVDDELENNYIYKLITTIKKQDVDTVICNYKEIFSNGEENNVLLPWKDEKIYENKIKNELIPNMIIAENENQTIKGLVWRTFTSKKMIDDNKLKFIKGIMIAEDFLFTIQLYNRSKSIYCLSDCLYKYHKNKNSSISKYYPDFLENQLNFQKNFVKILRKEDLYDNNKEREQISRARIYTLAISNEVRNNDNSIKDKYIRIKKIRKKFMEDKVDYRKISLSFTHKLSLQLLKYNYIYTLIFIYTIKEKIRLRKYK